MNIMKHKGYTARIEFDDSDNIFTGRVLGVRPIIGFHGETVEKLRGDFEEAIDFMLEDCKARGVSPEKPASGKLEEMEEYYLAADVLERVRKGQEQVHFAESVRKDLGLDG